MSGRVRAVTTKVLLRRWYEDIGQHFEDEREWICSNYGFDDLAGELGTIQLDEVEAPSRFPLQLYHLVARRGEVEGADVLEVGSGRGGGARYVVTRFAPASYTAVERSETALVFAREHSTAPGLSFVHGDAERLPCEGQSFDVVLNVESCHAYGDVPRFLREVHRVLRPGGRLSLADFGMTAEGPELLAEVRAAGLEVLDVRDITPEVLSSMRAREAYLHRFAEDRVPEALRAKFLSFAGAEGTYARTHLEAGTMVYACMLARRPT